MFIDGQNSFTVKFSEKNVCTGYEEFISPRMHAADRQMDDGPSPWTRPVFRLIIHDIVILTQWLIAVHRREWNRSDGH